MDRRAGSAAGHQGILLGASRVQAVLGGLGIMGFRADGSDAAFLGFPGCYNMRYGVYYILGSVNKEG